MDGFAALTQILPGLTLILAGLLAVRWWMTRGGRRRTGPSMRVVSRTSLSRTSVIAVVDIDGRRFLLGSGEQGTSLLAELDPDQDDAADTVVAAAAHDATASHDLPDQWSPGWDRSAPGPRTGLLDRLRAMTVRTPVARPSRAPELLRR